MQLLHRHPFVRADSTAAPPPDAGIFATRIEDYGILGPHKPGRFVVNSVMLDGLRLVALQTTGHHARLVDEESFGLLVAQRGTLFVDDGRGRTQVRGDEAAIWQPGTRTTMFPSSYTGLGLRVPLARFARHAAANPEDGWHTGCGWPVRPSPRLVRALRHVVRELDAPESLDPASGGARGMRNLLLDLLLDEVTAGAPQGAGPASVAGLCQVRQAEEALRERFQDAVSITALAGELGISTRSLQAAFRRHRGTAPRAFLAACRLEAARERLIAAGPLETVVGIAHDCGVMHLGRFAASYRARYGELPSATLARAQARAAAE